MRCLVTGASGHLGSYLTRLLVSRGVEVTVLVRPTSDIWRLEGILDRIRLIRGGLEDPAAAAKELGAAAADTVFHLAWSGTTLDRRNCPSALIDNVTGSLEFYRLCRQAGCRCWIGIGSQAEYGPQTMRLSEDMLPRPDSLYGISKLYLGRLLAALCEQSGVRFVWLRLLASYGPKDDPRHLIPSVIEQLLAGVRPSLTEGNQLWDYLYVEDAAEAIYSGAILPSVTGFYNLGSGRPETVRSIVERLRNMIDPALSLGFEERPAVPQTAETVYGDITKLHAATGWYPQTHLEDGLCKTLEWHKDRRRCRGRFA
jgi:UDP-glucose 4-epimerase